MLATMTAEEQWEEIVRVMRLIEPDFPNVPEETHVQTRDFGGHVLFTRGYTRANWIGDDGNIVDKLSAGDTVRERRISPDGEVVSEETGPAPGAPELN